MSEWGLLEREQHSFPSTGLPRNEALSEWGLLEREGMELFASLASRGMAGVVTLHLPHHCLRLPPFSLHSLTGETISREALIEAHGGNFRLFEKMDSDKDGLLTKTEWRCLY